MSGPVRDSNGRYYVLASVRGHNGIYDALTGESVPLAPGAPLISDLVANSGRVFYTACPVGGSLSVFELGHDLPLLQAQHFGMGLHVSQGRVFVVGNENGRWGFWEITDQAVPSFTPPSSRIFELSHFCRHGDLCQFQ